MGDKYDACQCCARAVERRRLLQAALTIGLGLQLPNFAAAKDKDPRKARPRKGDQLVFADGKKKGAVIAPGDVPLGGPQVMAHAMEPETRVVRNGSRLNRVLLLRFDPAELSEETRASAADGVVGYSAVCTHAGCDVAAWMSDRQVLHCPCHASEYDPKRDAKVVGGPARRSLAALPLTLSDSVLTVAGGFSGRVGFQNR